MQGRRKSGVLLHPTSLPGPGGIGSFGNECRNFIDILRGAGQSLWQVLPLGPAGSGNSPYSCYSAFAGNPLLVDLEVLVQEGDLSVKDLETGFAEDRVDFERVETYKRGRLQRAAEKFLQKGDGDASRKDEFRYFCENTRWLDDYALFMALKEANAGKIWRYWPEGIVRRTSEALAEHADRLGPTVALHKYIQWQFSRQWRKVKEYANASGIEIIGDIPIFVAYDSADVWANPQMFHLDESGRPVVVAGVPPDYFSSTGQLWGNPLYNWENIAFHGFGWWVDRMRSALQLYDMVRVDHFRGFEACWEVSATEKTAVNGRWVKGPGEALFNALIDAIGPLHVIAEDLGVITPDVEALRDKFGFAGMKILQFAFGSGSDNPYLPHNCRRHAVIYTGTHDNDTTAGWFAALTAKERHQILEYINCDAPGDVVWDLIRVAFASVADTVVIPLQDILGLGSSARMNIPGCPEENWTWRFKSEYFTDQMSMRLRHLGELYGRQPVSQ